MKREFFRAEKSLGKGNRKKGQRRVMLGTWRGARAKKGAQIQLDKGHRRKRGGKGKWKVLVGKEAH